MILARMKTDPHMTYGEARRSCDNCADRIGCKARIEITVQIMFIMSFTERIKGNFWHEIANNCTKYKGGKNV